MNQNKIYPMENQAAVVVDMQIGGSIDLIRYYDLQSNILNLSNLSSQ